MEMSHQMKKVCSNCRKAYSLADKLPLCPECIVDLSGYYEFVEGARRSSVFVPRRATDGPSLGSGA
jgi:predicted amidophosphoribosyltransferase